jgi:hypothetical protein
MQVHTLLFLFSPTDWARGGLNERWNLDGF